MSIRSFQVRPGLETGIFHIVLGNLKWHPHWKSIRDALQNDGAPIKVDYVMVDPTGRLNAWVRLCGLDNFERAVNVLKYTAIEGRIPTVYDRNRTDVVTIFCYDDTPQDPYYWCQYQSISSTLSPPPSPPPFINTSPSYPMPSTQTFQHSMRHLSSHMPPSYSRPLYPYTPYSMSPTQSLGPSINPSPVYSIQSPAVVSSYGPAFQRERRPSTPMVVNGSG